MFSYSLNPTSIIKNKTRMIWTMCRKISSKCNLFVVIVDWFPTVVINIVFLNMELKRYKDVFYMKLLRYMFAYIAFSHFKWHKTKDSFQSWNFTTDFFPCRKEFFGFQSRRLELREVNKWTIDKEHQQLTVLCSAVFNIVPMMFKWEILTDLLIEYYFYVFSHKLVAFLKMWVDHYIFRDKHLMH